MSMDTQINTYMCIGVNIYLCTTFFTQWEHDDTFAHVFKSCLSKSDNSQCLLVNIQHAYNWIKYVSTSFELHWFINLVSFTTTNNIYISISHRYVFYHFFVIVYRVSSIYQIWLKLQIILDITSYLIVNVLNNRTLYHAANILWNGVGLNKQLLFCIYFENVLSK